MTLDGQGVEVDRKACWCAALKLILNDEPVLGLIADNILKTPHPNDENGKRHARLERLSRMFKDDMVTLRLRT